MTEIKLPDPPYGMSSEARERWENEQKKLLKKNGGLEKSLENEPKSNRSFRNFKNLSIATLLLGAGVLSAAYFTSCNKKVEIPSGYVSEQVLISTRDSAYTTGYENGIKTAGDSLAYYRATLSSLIERTKEDAAIIKTLNEDLATRRYLQSH